MATRPMTPPPRRRWSRGCSTSSSTWWSASRCTEADAAYRRGHRFGNALLTGMLARLFGRSFTDILSGYRVFSRRFVKSFPVAVRGLRDRDRDQRPRARAEDAGRRGRDALFRAAGRIGVEAEHLSRRLAHPADDRARCTGSSGRCCSSARSARCWRWSALILARAAGRHLSRRPGWCRASRRRSW